MGCDKDFHLSGGALTHFSFTSFKSSHFANCDRSRTTSHKRGGAWHNDNGVFPEVRCSRHTKNLSFLLALCWRNSMMLELKLEFLITIELHCDVASTNTNANTNTNTWRSINSNINSTIYPPGIIRATPATASASATPTPSYSNINSRSNSNSNGDISSASSST